MSLRVLTRRAKIELFSSDDDVCSLLFSQKRAQHACRLFLEFLKASDGCTRHELNKFSLDLAAGRVEPGFRYSRPRFYQQIRRTLLTLGLIAIQEQFMTKTTFEGKSFRTVEKYIPVPQPIPRRPPDGLNLVRLTWNLCRRWNEEFSDMVER